MRSPCFALFIGALVGTVVMMSQPILSPNAWTIPASMFGTMLVVFILQAAFKKR